MLLLLHTDQQSGFTLVVVSLTHKTAIEHPGSHQGQRKQEEDEVGVIPGTWMEGNFVHDTAQVYRYNNWTELPPLFRLYTVYMYIPDLCVKQLHPPRRPGLTTTATCPYLRCEH